MYISKAFTRNKVGEIVEYICCKICILVYIIIYTVLFGKLYI